MAKKRERLEVIYDILKSIERSHNHIKPTRLMQSSNLSPQMFTEYIAELRSKEFIRDIVDPQGKRVYTLTSKGNQFLAEYKTILQFIENFGL